MNYKERLRAFNSTEKYRKEISFLKHLTRQNYMLLDYGCGLGSTAKDLGAFGYDINNYNECLTENRYLKNLPDVNMFDGIYFLHSFAHLQNPVEILKGLKFRYPQAQVTVITPNLHWLMMQSNRDYTPDPTVVKHYTMTELKNLFEQAGYKVTLLGQFGEEKNGINERLFLQAV